MVTRRKADQPAEKQTSNSGWKYRINDKEVDQQTYLEAVREHQEWIEQQEHLAAAAAAAEEQSTKRKKRSKL